MIKQDKSFMAISLGLILSSQNMMLISNAESINSSSGNESSIISDNGINIKVNTESKESYTNSKEEDTNISNKYDTTIEEDKVNDTVENSSAVHSTASKAYSLNSMNLSSSNAIGSGTITSDNLSVRSGPSTSYGILGTLSLNDTVQILGTSNGWYKINYNGKEGYISSTYLKLNIIEKGIDVSKWNGAINWKSVKNSGIEYVIIRAGHGTSTVDPQFKSHIEGAINAGLKIGVYWFSYATNAEKAVIEAQKCLETLSPYKSSITYPVFFDFEYDSVRYATNNGVTITKNLTTQMANAFLDTVKTQGYTTGIYTNRDFSSTYYTDDLINSNILWIAQYSSTNTFGKPYSMWQYSEKGTVPGINGYVDLNYTVLKPFSRNSDNDIPSAPSEDGVTTANVNFRNSASTSSSIITTIPKNTSVKIINKSDSDWYKIEYKGVTGYVSSKYVKLGSSDTPDTPDTPSEPTQKGVTTANVNFRNSASTSSSIITTIPKGTNIEIISKYDSNWYKVEYKGVNGYISSQYVKLGSSDTPDTPSEPTQKSVTTGSVNFRKSASTSSSIITKLSKGTSIEIISKYNSSWYKIKYNGITGYVSSKYVKLNSDAPVISTKNGITNANVNFRKSASTSSSIIATIPKSTTIGIVSKYNSSWYKVEYKGVTGYVSSQYVNTEGDTPVVTTQKGTTSANLNFRKSASSSASIINTIPKNTKVEIISKLSSGWYKVKYNGITGYVSGNYVNI